MTDQTKKIVLPAYLVRRCEAFRIVSGEVVSYVLRDKLHSKTHDFEPWQFFILEVLLGCESLAKLQSVFKDRFDRDLSSKEVDDLFTSLADNKLLDESAVQHPLLKPFVQASEKDAGAPVPPSDAAPAPPAQEAGTKVILPPYLVRRCEAYRNETAEGYVYILSDKM